MTLSIDCSVLISHGWSGIHYYAFNILDELVRLDRHQEFLLHFDSGESHPALEPILQLPNVTRIDRGGHLNFAARTPLDLWLRGSKAYYSFITARLRTPMPCPAAFIIHDCGWILFPQFYDQALARRQHKRLVASARRAAALFTVSETVKREVAELLDYPLDRIHVAPNSHVRRDVAPVPPEGFPGRPFFLMVNPGRPNKNVLTAIEAFKRFREQQPASDHMLVLAGAPRGEEPHIKKKVADLELGGSVYLSYYVPDETLEYFYRHADVLLFPSWYEGFGIPILEAFDHDLPAVIADISVFREVAGESALFVAPDDPDGFAAACARVLEDGALRKGLVEGGRERMKHYSWRQSAQTTLDVLRALS